MNAKLLAPVVIACLALGSGGCSKDPDAAGPDGSMPSDDMNSADQALPLDGGADLAMQGGLPWDPKERASDPDLPNAEVVIPAVPCKAPAFQVSNEAELQAALAGAQPGDGIELTASFTIAGPVDLPAKGPGTDYITIYSTGWACAPPVAFAEHRPDVPHVDPSTSMMTITTNGNGVFNCAPGAHHFHFVGVEMRYGAGVTDSSGIARMYVPTQTNASEQPHHLILDRCRLRGSGAIGGANHVRGVILNADHAAVHQSYVDGFLNNNSDGQAIASWSSAGPLRITNNFLEGSHENIILGGAPSAYPEGREPADVEIRWNHMYKRNAWLGSGKTKNLFEIKFALRVLVEGNILENFREDAQETAVNVKTESPASGIVEETSHVTFRRNVFRKIDARWFKILTGSTFTPGNVMPHDVLWADNIVDGNVASTASYELGLVGADAAYPLHDIAIRRNTALGAKNGFIEFTATGGLTNFSVESNIASLGQYGVKAPSTTIGTPSLAAACPGGYVFTNNVLQGTSNGTYPATTVFPAQVSDIGFVDFQPSGGGDLHLASGSPWKGSAGGKDPGADVDRVTAATNGVAYTPAVP